MSVRVNLLPQETFARQAAVRQRRLVAVGAFVLLGLLGGAYWTQLQRVDDAQLARDEAQQELRELEAREAQLADYRDLEQRVEQANAAVSSALSQEMSLAAVLQDIAAVMPAEAALESLDITTIEDNSPDGDVVRPVVARMAANGEVLRGHAPGVERLLLELDKIGAFFGVYVTNSTIDVEDDPDVAHFSFEVDVGQEARTGRYESGVPEELR